MERIRVVVVGKTGQGKSSLIAALTGATVPVNDASIGCTLKCSIYSVEHDGKIIDFIDTPGFAEAASGNVNTQKAFELLLNALETDKKGWDLLIYVKSATEKLDTTDEDYVALCCHFVCGGVIPCILALTHSDKLDSFKNKVDIQENKWLHQDIGNGETNLDAYLTQIGSDSFYKIQQVAFPPGTKQVALNHTNSSKAVLFHLICEIGVREECDRLYSIFHLFPSFQQGMKDFILKEFEFDNDPLCEEWKDKTILRGIYSLCTHTLANVASSRPVITYLIESTFDEADIQQKISQLIYGGKANKKAINKLLMKMGANKSTFKH